VYPLLALAGIAVVAVGITYGYSRYRAPAEVSLVILAAVGIDAALERARRRGLRAAAWAGGPIFAAGVAAPPRRG
jgi:hypothetical protein